MRAIRVRSGSACSVVNRVESTVKRNVYTTASHSSRGDHSFVPVGSLKSRYTISSSSLRRPARHHRPSHHHKPRHQSVSTPTSSPVLSSNHSVVALHTPQQQQQTQITHADNEIANLWKAQQTKEIIQHFAQLPSFQKAKLSKETYFTIMRAYVQEKDYFNAVRMVRFLHDKGLTPAEAAQVLRDAKVYSSPSPSTNEDEDSPRFFHKKGQVASEDEEEDLLAKQNFTAERPMKSIEDLDTNDEDDEPPFELSSNSIFSTNTSTDTSKHERRMQLGFAHEMGAWGTHGIDRSIWIYDVIKELDLQPSPLLLGKLMEAYNRKQMYKETLTLFDKLKADNIRIPLVVYNAVLYTYFQLKDLDKVNDLLQNELGSRMINRYTLSVLLSEYAKLRDATKAFEVYQVMRQCKMKVSLEHCHSVMMASGRTGKFTLAMKLYKDLQSRNLHTEETILTMINVAKLCQDAASEIQLWKDKHELTRKLNGRYGAEDEEKQKEALKKLNKLCWEKFQTYPSFPVLSTTREDGIRSVTVGVVLAKEDAPFVTATGTSVNDAIFKVAPQALEIIQGFLQEHLPIVEQQLQKQQQQQQQQQQQ